MCADNCPWSTARGSASLQLHSFAVLRFAALRFAALRFTALRFVLLRLAVLRFAVVWFAVSLLAIPAAAQPEASRAQTRAESGPARSDSDGPDERIVLNVGEQSVLPAEGVSSYSEGTRGVVDVRLTRDGSHFVLVGQEPGTTTLLFIMMDGNERLLLIEVPDPKISTEEPEALVQEVDNVRLDFYFVQLDRSNNVNVGVGYPASVSGGTFSGTFDFLSQSFQAATAVVEDQALLRLDMAQTAGWAKLMRKAAVITENGKTAVFSGGGEVNIPVQGSLTTGIHRIDFGSTIEVLPIYDEKSGRLRIQLSADVADLTDDRGSGAPGRVTSSINTVVNLELGQTLVLAGLSSSSRQKSRSGVPILSQIPILGYLFGSERMNHQMSDNVVFIVPSVINAADQEAREGVGHALAAYRDYTGGRAEPVKLRTTWSRKRPVSPRARQRAEGAK